MQIKQTVINNTTVIVQVQGNPQRDHHSPSWPMNWIKSLITAVTVFLTTAWL